MLRPLPVDVKVAADASVFVMSEASRGCCGMHMHKREGVLTHNGAVKSAVVKSAAAACGHLWRGNALIVDTSAHDASTGGISSYTLW